MTIGTAENWLAQQLHQCYDKIEAPKIASMVLEHLTDMDNGQRRLHRSDVLTGGQLELLTDYNKRLQQGEPVQYILEEAWFYDFRLYVNRNVLIPRPETEELVHWIVQDVKASGKPVLYKRPTDADQTDLLKILDVGTGSGCIALALKRKLPLAEVWGCDTSEDALNIARRNGSELDIRVDFTGLNFLDAAQWRQLPQVDILVSNPPYIPLQEADEMPRNVVQFEPHQALFVPDNDPLIFYEAIASFAAEHLHEQGSIYLEVHEQLGKEVAALFQHAGFSTEIRKDMQGKERMVKAIR